MNLASSLIDWPDLFLRPGGLKILLVLLLFLLIGTVAFVEWIRSARTRAKVRGRAGGVPMPREVWWAEVPFEDGPGSKDRPCLVLKVKDRTVIVAKITSKHHDRPGMIAIPRGMVGDAAGRASWLETDEQREVPLADFRRRAGLLDERTWAAARRLVS